MGHQELLAEADLFRLLPADALDTVAAGVEVREVARNDVLFDQGDEAHEMFVVAEGRVAIASKSFDGRESMMALMERGDLFGEMGLFDDHGRSAEARALEATTVLAIDYRVVHDVLDADPTLLWGVIRLLVGRLRATDQALSDAVFLDVTGRTAKRLLEIAGDADEFVLPITQEELAGMVGASRERVNKAISSFVRLGWLEQRDGTYRITDRRQMEIRSN